VFPLLAWKGPLTRGELVQRAASEVGCTLSEVSNRVLKAVEVLQEKQLVSEDPDGLFHLEALWSGPIRGPWTPLTSGARRARARAFGSELVIKHVDFGRAAGVATVAYNPSEYRRKARVPTKGQQEERRLRVISAALKK
jgi:hypothetical protein